LLKQIQFCWCYESSVGAQQRCSTPSFSSPANSAIPAGFARHILYTSCIYSVYVWVWLNYTPSFAMLSTLNNAQDLDLEYLNASFSIKWTMAHESAGKLQCGVIGEMVLRTVDIVQKQRMHGSNPCSTISPQSTVTGSLYCSSWSRSVLPSF